MSGIDDQRRMLQDKLRAEMPMSVRGHGVWEGVYRHLDPDGKIVDQHRSRLLIRMAESGPHPVHQTNLYYWDDGRAAKFDFMVGYANHRLIFDNENILGYFSEIAEDDHNQSILGYWRWRRPGLENIFAYELIVRQAATGHRTRVWQWIKDTGGVFRRTIIDEKKVSDDWKTHAHHLNEA